MELWMCREHVSNIAKAQNIVFLNSQISLQTGSFENERYTSIVSPNPWTVILRVSTMQKRKIFLLVPFSQNLNVLYHNWPMVHLTNY